MLGSCFCAGWNDSMKVALFPTAATGFPKMMAAVGWASEILQKDL
jgi:hypothetical protein